MVARKYKHFIFDMGNVLMDFNPKYILSKYFSDISKINHYYEYYFKSGIWGKLDNGDIEFSQLEEDAQKNYPEDYEILKNFLQTWQEHKWERQAMTEIVKHLSKQGYGIHLCSNAARRFHDYQNNYSVFQYFDSITISADLNHSKPDHFIYEKVLRDNNLIASECLFIDDLKENIYAAEALGIDGYHYNGNEAMFVAFLKNINNY